MMKNMYLPDKWLGEEILIAFSGTKYAVEFVWRCVLDDCGPIGLHAYPPENIAAMTFFPWAGIESVRLAPKPKP